MYQWLQRLFTGSDQPAAEKKPEPAAPPKAPAPVAPAANTVPAAAAKPAPPPAAPPAAPASAPAPAAAAPAAPPKPSQTAVTGLSFDQKDDVNAAYYDWLFERGTDTDLDTNALEEQVLESIDKIIKSKSSGADMVRRMPGLIPQLLQSLKSDNFSGAQLSRTISHDVVLVAAVIRLANSSILATSKTITSVEHAVIRIGQEGLRQLITSVAFRPIIDMHSGVFTRLLAPRIWDQSERNALANRIMAEGMGIDPFEAFLAGLVQNVGLIVTLRIMDQAAKDTKHLGSEMFCAALLRDARTLSCTIAREWNFAPAISQAIQEQGNVRKGESMSPLGRLLALGDYLAKARILVEHERMSESDPRLFRGLSPGVRECYLALDAPVMDEPGGATVA